MATCTSERKPLKLRNAARRRLYVAGASASWVRRYDRATSSVSALIGAWPT
ncbi:MAG TPA: hypothetical protein VL485_24755 [Ktedonobacteraceae bacterium]|nr:hypothetical protein [Ktedonobacteraceae bacterium]